MFPFSLYIWILRIPPKLVELHCHFISKSLVAICMDHFTAQIGT